MLWNPLALALGLRHELLTIVGVLQALNITAIPRHTNVFCIIVFIVFIHLIRIRTTIVKLLFF